MALDRFRERMPLVAFLLLLVVCVALLGIACACFGDEYALAFERALETPAVVEVWLPLTLVVLGLTPLVVMLGPALGRASPALLQRFLF